MTMRPWLAALLAFLTFTAQATAPAPASPASAPAAGQSAAGSASATAPGTGMPAATAPTAPGPATPAASAAVPPLAGTPAGSPAAGTPAAGSPAVGSPSVPYTGPSVAGPGLLQTLMALILVLGMLAGLTWLLKRFGPRGGAAAAGMRVVGALSLGGRERVVVVEVAGQWIVTGVAPGRVNLLMTMPRQEGVDAPPAAPPNAFGDWLKQTLEKRHAT